MKRFTTLAILLAVLTILALGAWLYNYAVNSRLRISSEEAKRRIRQKEIDLILDVRTSFERDTLGFYPGSVHIESGSLEKEMETRYPNKSIKILVYCNTGQRARRAADKLIALGYTNVSYISSGHTSLF